MRDLGRSEFLKMKADIPVWQSLFLYDNMNIMKRLKQGDMKKGDKLVSGYAALNVRLEGASPLDIREQVSNYLKFCCGDLATVERFEFALSLRRGCPHSYVCPGYCQCLSCFMLRTSFVLSSVTLLRRHAQYGGFSAHLSDSRWTTREAERGDAGCCVGRTTRCVLAPGACLSFRPPPSTPRQARLLPNSESDRRHSRRPMSYHAGSKSLDQAVASLSADRCRIRTT